VTIHPKVLLGILAAVATSLGQLAACADTLYLQSGATVQGFIQSFDGQRYRVLLDGEMVTYEAAEVRAFSIERPETTGQDSEAIRLILRKLDTLDSKLDSFSQEYQSTTREIQQKVFDLNPISLVRVLSQRGRFNRDGSYVVTGRLLNDSNEVVRHFRLRATLLDPNEVALNTVDVTPRNRTIGPGATVPFQVDFPNAPRDIGGVEIVPYLATRSTDEDVGDYQQRNPVQRYRQ